MKKGQGALQLNGRIIDEGSRLRSLQDCRGARSSLFAFGSPVILQSRNAREAYLGAAGSPGAPVPVEPMNSLRPSGNVRSRPFALRVPSLAW